ncbi:Signal recognition particle protein [Rickettsiales endosymbiont of Paramecium tredecaurelia]|uniref:signal recognition particle protein n=1 Tax=Candidatus Sarmatiella mevalonica TaxID=2770581 RepID=UPI0019235B25|nr:signal recognition particle protein [Candidatus Sarmatiella mevalonica]MBL3284238.1 Signal recognition particle protein [Candidatus Sarmatiella mevalonica]
MFETLTKNLSAIFNKISSGGKLSEKQVDQVLDQIKIALIESDVNLKVVESFVSQVRDDAVGLKVVDSVSPHQMMIKIVYDQIVKSLKKENHEIKITQNKPLSIMMVGLQGSGKTTACAKIANYFKDKKTLLVSLDTYRPAAQEQLKILAQTLQCESLDIVAEENPEQIARRAIDFANKSGFELIIYDTAGRLQIDAKMMSEACELQNMIKPQETLLVIDSLIGQEGLNVAREFDKALKLSGMILSRIDSDSKGGVALSVSVLSHPIKFLSTGEKVTDLELFDAQRIANRILDQGDVVAFVEKAQAVAEEVETEKITKRIQKGKFNLNDYLVMMSSIDKMGGVMGVVSFLPGMSSVADKIKDSGSDNILKKHKAIIFSMTPKERKDPDLLNASRKQRIAKGSGTTVQDINLLMKQYEKMKSVVKQMKGMDPMSLLSGKLGGGFKGLFK